MGVVAAIDSCAVDRVVEAPAVTDGDFNGAFHRLFVSDVSDGVTGDTACSLDEPDGVFECRFGALDLAYRSAEGIKRGEVISLPR